MDRHEGRALSETTPNLTEPGSDQPQDPREEATRLAEVIARGLRGLYKSGITRMAAALAYRTIFSLIPMLAIGLLIFGSIVSEEKVEAGVRRVMEFAGVSQISVNDSVNQGDAARPDTRQPVTRDQVDGVMPTLELPLDEEAAGVFEGPPAPSSSGPIQSDAEIEEIIADLVLRVNSALQNLPTGWIAFVTGLVLLYAALSMIIEVEKSFNQICRAPGGRRWIIRVVLYWFVLTAGAVLLAATFLAGDALASWVRGSGGSAVRSTLAGYGVSVLISTMLLGATYMVIPTVRLRFRPVLAGAFTAAVCWELGKLGFTAYLKYSTGYAQFYGSLALLPLFMLWVYVTWVIVLLGLQSAYTLQNFTRLMATDEHDDSDGPRLVDPAMVVAVMTGVVASHRAGDAAFSDGLGDKLGVDASVVHALLRRLEEAGLIRRLAGSDGEGGWVPSRPGETIRVAEVLDSVSDLDAARSSAASGGVPRSILTELSKARRQVAESRTLGEEPGGVS